MKKILLFASAVAAMFAAGSCQKELVHLDGDTHVTFEVSTGEIATKAIADGTNISVLHWELYGSDIETAASPYGEGKVVDTDGNKSFTVDLRLVADQDYKIVFWAETEHGATHYDTQDLRSVKINTYSDENANDESRAAFFGSYAFHTENGVNVNQKVTLYRPFAQINLGTTNYETSLNQVNGGKLIVESTEMTVNAIANSFNTLQGVGEVDENFSGVVTFQAAATPNGAADQNEKKLVVNGNSYYWVGMNYLIVEGNSDAIKVDVKLNTNMGTVAHTIENVPVKENYRTNILGDFLTIGAEFEIVIEERFEQPDQVVSMWDGTSVEEPEYDAATSTYEISNAAELAWFAGAVNGTLTKAVAETFAGKTVKVVADIDLQNAPWTPIGYWETFEGTFDGGNHMIRNINVTAKEADCYLGLFGCTKNATIKNVNIHNAVVKATVGDDSWAGGHLGVLVGYPDGTTVIENVTLTGDIKVEGPMNKKGAQRIGAVVGGFEATSLTLNNVTVDANKGSYVKGNLYVGGVVGQPICPVAMTDVVSNIDVYAQDGMVGGIAGYVMPNSTLTNCSSTGNVYRVSATGSENQLKRIGGILGSWESKYGKVVLDGCTFEGGLYNGGAEYTDYLYGGLVGRAATTTEDAKGVIIINGLTFISEGLAVDAEGNYYAYSAAGLQQALDAAVEGTTTIFFGQNIAGDAIVKQTEGKNIVINGLSHNYDGTIYIWGNARYTGAETLAIQNVNFKHAEGSIDFISSNSTASAERYAHNVTIEGCTFEGDANAIATRFRQAFNITIKNSKVLAGHSLAQLYGCTGFAIEDVIVKAGRGVSFGTSTACTVSKSTFEADSYGLRADGKEDNGSLTVSNTSIKANQPVIVRNMTGNYAVALDGAVLETSASYHVVFTKGADDAEYVAPTGTYSLTGAEGYNVYPVVAKKLYRVTNVNELLKYAYMVNNEDKTLQLEILNDITLPQYEIAADDAKQTYVYTTTPITVSAAGVPSGSNWKPLGTASAMFEGTIDGKGNTIKGLRLVSSSDLLGFVAAAQTAGTTIMNLNFEDAVLSGASYVGTVAGYVRDGVVTKNCHMTSVSVKGNSDVGAVVGRNYTRYSSIQGVEGGKLPKSVMENCTTDKTSNVKGNGNVGGIAGLNYGGILINCSNAATVEGVSYVGGITGYSRDYHHYKSGYVIACGNEGKVSGNSANTSSIIGTSLKDNNHTESVSAMVACWSTAEVGSYEELLVAYCVNGVNYGSWGIKTKSNQIVTNSGKTTACYAFDSAAKITKEQVDAMNAAIDSFNIGKTPADSEYCPYKWSWTEGSLPVLTK